MAGTPGVTGFQGNTWTVEKTVSVGTSNVEVMASSPTRIGFCVRGRSTNTGRLALSNNPNGLGDAGIHLSAADPPTFVRYADLGSCVQNQWWCISSVAAQNISILEFHSDAF